MTLAIIVTVLIVAILINTIIENKIAINNNKDLIDNINKYNDRN